MLECSFQHTNAMNETLEDTRTHQQTDHDLTVTHYSTNHRLTLLQRFFPLNNSHWLSHTCSDDTERCYVLFNHRLLLWSLSVRVQLTTSIVIVIIVSNRWIGHFDDSKTKDEGGRIASSSSSWSVCCSSFFTKKALKNMNWLLLPLMNPRK